MLGHSWPGNVRELKNFVERAAIFADGDILCLQHVSPQYTSGTRTIADDFRHRLELSAHDAIIEAIQLAGGSKSKAAKLLNIDRKTIYNHLKRTNQV
jgi:two-component system response regulator HydG